MAAIFKFFTKLGKVIDLAVEYGPNGAIFVKDRLMAPGQIDNAEAAHAQSHAIFDENALIVGAAIHNGLAHAMDGLGID
jgi:hypothetical protein